MADRKLDKQTMDVVKKAWASLLQRYQKDGTSDDYHWIDNEGDVGFLKDVDAMNALIEPFLLSPSSFVDPPLKLTEVASRFEKLLGQLFMFADDPKADTRNAESYRGFSAAPYPYVQMDVDFVDSASAVLRLICNVAKLFTIQKQPLPDALEKRMSNAAAAAIDFLIDARVEDRSGARWSGFGKQIDTAGKFANLFFTNCAALALHESLDAPFVKNWVVPKREQIESILRKAVVWVAKQYDPATNGFWMDEARTQTQTMGVLYALEVLYTVSDSLSEELRTDCAKALTAVLEKMNELAKASSLQRDFYHILPLPAGPGITYYDDRKYIGAFLSLLTLARTKDANIMSDAFAQAGNVLFSGVSEEWIDEPTNLWDDGRPLICFSQDALVGLVNYALEGKVDTLNLTEFELRSAVKSTLKSDEVVDLVFNVLLDRAREGKEKGLSRMIDGARQDQ